MKLLFPLSLLALWLLSSPSCSKNSAKGSSNYFSTMTALTVEVAYEPGAEPFTGTLPNTQNIWTILEQNLNALFASRTKVPTVTVPKDLASMTALAAQGQSTWTNEKLLTLANANRKGATTATSTYFYVMFLKGYLDKDGAADQSVLGVSLTGTTVVAIFKDVINSTSALPTGGGAVTKFVEQSTLVHETAHALGLVNNGIPMQVAHQDTAHGAHCDNTSCVMYYSNDGTSNAVAFVQKYLTTSSYVMFDDKCLNDAHNFAP